MVVYMYDKFHVQWSIQLLMLISHPLDKWIVTDEEPRKTTKITRRDDQSQHALRSKR